MLTCRKPIFLRCAANQRAQRNTSAACLGCELMLGKLTNWRSSETNRGRLFTAYRDEAVSCTVTPMRIRVQVHSGRAAHVRTRALSCRLCLSSLQPWFLPWCAHVCSTTDPDHAAG